MCQTPTMPSSETARYGDVWGPYYDELYSQVDIDAVGLLEELAGPERRLLELGVGTGRVALPLVQRGIRITGIDESEVMVEKLRQKPVETRSTSSSATSPKSPSTGPSRSHSWGSTPCSAS